MSANEWTEIQLPKVIRDGLKTTGAVGIRGFQRAVDGREHLSVLICKEPTGWHLSISLRTNGVLPQPGSRYPTWNEIRAARYDLLADELTMAMLLPPRDEYVNVHPTTFHLFEIEP